jgi:hypothetical protein
MQTSIVGKRSVNAQQLTGIDAIKSVEIDCVNATIIRHLWKAMKNESHLHDKTNFILHRGVSFYRKLFK